RSFSWQNSFCVLPLLFHTSINENINCRVVMSVELSIALLFSSKTIPSASSLKYVLYRWVTSLQTVVQGLTNRTLWYLAGFFEQVKSRDFLTLTIQNSHEEDQIHRSPDHWDLER